MSYSHLKKEAFKLRRAAVSGGIQSDYLALADSYIDRAMFFRSDTCRRPSREKYERAVGLMLVAVDVLESYVKKSQLIRSNTGAYKWVRAELNSA